MDRMGVDWSNLNKDLLQVIGEKLDSYAGYLRFRSVSVEWASTLPKKPRSLQQKVPYLLLPPPNEEEDCNRNSLPHTSLLNPLDGKVVDRLELIEEARGEADKLLFKGCSKGWLIAMEKEGISIHLINIFPSVHDDHHRLLPPISTFPDVLEYRPDRVGEEFLLSSGVFRPTGYISDDKLANFRYMSLYFLKKIVLSSPPTGTNCIAMAIYGEFCYLAYSKYGGERWTKVGGKTEERSYKDILFYQDKFFALRRSGDVAVIAISNLDSSPTAVVTQIENPSKLQMSTTLYLAGVDDVLLVLYRKLLHYVSKPKSESEDEDDDNDETEDEDNADEDDDEDEEEEEFDLSRFSYETASFEILFKLDLHSLDLDSNTCGVLHNHALFLGHNEALALPSKNFPGCKRNHIYFSDYNFDLHNAKIKTRGSDIGVFDIQNKTVQPLHGYEHRQLLWPAPVWVMHLNHP